MRSTLWYSLALVTLLRTIAVADPNFVLYVSNERSGDVTIVDAATSSVVASIRAGKRPRGIHATSDGKTVYVTLSGSPRLGPGVDRERIVADKTADGLGVIDAAATTAWH